MDLKAINDECNKIIKYMNAKCDDFPNGACGITSRLLAYVLQDRYNVSCLNIISAIMKQNPIQSHAWVWADGYIFDLTISQFNNCYGLNYPKVYISPNNKDFNELFDYNCYNSLVPIDEGENEEIIAGYYQENNYEFRERVVIKVNYNGQDLED